MQCVKTLILRVNYMVLHFVTDSLAVYFIYSGKGSFSFARYILYFGTASCTRMRPRHVFWFVNAVTTKLFVRECAYLFLFVSETAEFFLFVNAPWLFVVGECGHRRLKLENS